MAAAFTISPTSSGWALAKPLPKSLIYAFNNLPHVFHYAFGTSFVYII